MSFTNWNYTKEELPKNREYYGRVLAIDEKSLQLLFLHCDDEVNPEKIYCVVFEEKDLEWYKRNMDSQLFYQDDYNTASKDKGNLPLKYIRGPRVEIINQYDHPIFLKTKAI